MPERHTALAVLIDLPTAKRLFPGTPYGVFLAHALPDGRRDPRLTFGAAFRAAAAYWEPRAKAAQAARFSVTHINVWKARKSIAAKAAVVHLQSVIRAEMAELTAREG
ncbi:hypothetical protein [Gemmobacter serpentinus]|uniref:hypothetical protein n=1 Tax=Gemmobacter serpentinus TaxID=2652247 RepID=UPI00124C2221|nr:hypothetical protein [Gemmobacter serpentinus]